MPHACTPAANRRRCVVRTPCVHIHHAVSFRRAPTAMLRRAQPLRAAAAAAAAALLVVLLLSAGAQHVEGAPLPFNFNPGTGPFNFISYGYYDSTTHNLPRAFWLFGTLTNFIAAWTNGVVTTKAGSNVIPVGAATPHSYIGFWPTQMISESSSSRYRTVTAIGPISRGMVGRYLAQPVTELLAAAIWTIDGLTYPGHSTVNNTMQVTWHKQVVG